MTEPIGSYWDQPDRKDITIDDTHALMNNATFKKLANYSSSRPSGAYEGKMWKRGQRENENDSKEITWYLCWFGFSAKPGHVSTNLRKIIIID